MNRPAIELITIFGMLSVIAYIALGIPGIVITTMLGAIVIALNLAPTNGDDNGG